MAGHSEAHCHLVGEFGVNCFFWAQQCVCPQFQSMLNKSQCVILNSDMSHGLQHQKLLYPGTNQYCTIYLAFGKCYSFDTLWNYSWASMKTSGLVDAGSIVEGGVLPVASIWEGNWLNVKWATENGLFIVSQDWQFQDPPIWQWHPNDREQDK